MFFITFQNITKSGISDLWKKCIEKGCQGSDPCIESWSK